MKKPRKTVLKNRTEYRLNGELHREDGPARIRSDGTEMWYHHGQQHREDGPAYIQKDGSEKWYLHGLRHREDGPACTYNDGSEEWYIEGIELTKKDTKTAIKVLSEEYPFIDLPLLINHPVLKYFAKRKLSQEGTK